MPDHDLAALTDEALGEHFRALMRAYDEACLAYDHNRAADIHQAFYAAEAELRKRRGAEWRRTGLEQLSVDDIVARFRVCAIAYEDADGSDETEHLYWDVENAKDELKRREGDQRRALFRLYMDPDIRVRALAADATRTLAPLLATHRRQNIEDDQWAPPASGLDIARAGISAFFRTPVRRRKAPASLSIEALVDRFVALSLKQDDALNRDELARYNRQFHQLEEVIADLKARDSDRRDALLVLLEHPNLQVRLTAAQATLAVAPEASRAVIQAIADSKIYPQAGDAGMCLWALEQGIYKPT